jgi:riboflavin kinase/FMN adenylyltransferase
MAEPPQMEVFRRLPPPERRRPCALTIGNFDGVHVGHQEMLGQLGAAARARGLPVCVLTFEPHPREWFSANPRPGMTPVPPPARISTSRDKLEALAECGVDRVCIAHFNASLASLGAEAFIRTIIVEGLQAAYLMVGDDFRFGARRAGDFAMLEQAAPRFGFELARQATVERAGVRVSSSAIREALAAGDMKRAQTLLGRPYTISGRVIHGRKLGRTLGFPTLNLPVRYARPAVSGVFVVQVHGLSEHPLPGVASLGTRPAVERDGRLLLEVHLFAFSREVYGERIRVEFLHKLRDEADFESLELLTGQIHHDAEQAREWFARQL